MKKTFLFILLLVSGVSVLAATKNTTFNDVSENLFVPASIFAGVMKLASYVIGVCFIIGSVMQYQMYRINPKVAPLNKILFVLFFGILLLFLPFFAENYGGISETRAQEVLYNTYSSDKINPIKFFNRSDSDKANVEKSEYEAELDEYSDE